MFSDTQTGRRGLPACAIPAMITIDGERYEYEMNVLLKLRDMKLGVVEVPIETIYIDDNSGSHFNPVRDAIRIYAVIFKYLFSSVTSFAVDYLLYWLCLGVFKLAPLLSYALARLVSSQVNYHLNKHTVFSGRGGKHSMVKYYALAVVQGLLGAGLVQFLPTVLPISAAVVKIPVDLLLFAASYFIQRDFVFDK
ncbi:MAG: GtrA family protein [Christensenellales bacterium]